VTIPQLYRELADLTEENEALKAEVASLRAENSALKQQVPAEQKQWLTPAEAAKFIGVKDTFFRNNRHKPDAIPFRKDGHRSIYYHRDELIKYAKTGKRCGLQKRATKID